MDDLHKKLAFLEARLTLLERQFSTRMGQVGDSTNSLPSGHVITIDCDMPGLLIFRSYPSELDPSNTRFCWIGNDGPLQFVFPVPAKQRMSCRVRLDPHGKVDLQPMRIFANDIEIRHSVERHNDAAMIDFEIPESAHQQISVMFTNVTSVRPVDLGENSDVRFLAGRFYRAVLTVL